METCRRCQDGSWSDPGASECNACLAGTIPVGSGCSHCDIGERYEGPGVCSPCPPGSYNDELGQLECLPCPPGTASATEGAAAADACQACLPGTFSSSVGSAVCEPCPNGTFSNTTAAETESECAICPPGTYAGAGASQCTFCPPLTITNGSANFAVTDCIPCAFGFATEIETIPNQGSRALFPAKLVGIRSWLC